LIRSKLATLPKWAALSAASAFMAWLFELISLPAALFLGPMIAAIGFGVAGAKMRVARPPYFLSLGIVGCMVAGMIDPGIAGVFARDWFLFLAVIASIVAATSAVGWWMTRAKILPGTTAIWGTSAGAGLPMIVMAESHGGDARLVAFMHYLRVLVVAAVSSVIARFWLGSSAVPPHAVDWFPAISLVPFAETMSLAVVVGYIGHRMRLPAGPFLLPLIVGIILRSMGLLHIELPPWLLAVNFAVLGWSFGLTFDRQILMHALRVLPQILLSIALLIGSCALLGVALAYAADVDMLTAYLATSPGSYDSMAIIAASSRVDVSFVMAMQTVRLFILLFIGPHLAKVVAQLAERPSKPAA